MAARAISSFLGPSYHPGNRAVTTPTGQVVQPQTNRSVGKPMLVKGNAGSMNSKPVSRGGFSSPNNTHRSSGGLNETCNWVSYSTKYGATAT